MYLPTFIKTLHAKAKEPFKNIFTYLLTYLDLEQSNIDLRYKSLIAKVASSQQQCADD